MGAGVPAGGVPGPEPLAVIIHAVGYGVQYVGPRHPAQVVAVEVLQPSPRPDGDGARVEPGALVSVDVLVQGLSDGSPRPAVGGVIRDGAARMDEGHPGVCEGGVNDVGGRYAVGTGSIAPHVGARMGPAAKWGLAGPRIVPRCIPCMLCLLCRPAICM